MTAQERPYGSWRSTLTADMVARGESRLGDLQVDGEDVYWIEGRAAEHGRCVIVRSRDAQVEDVIGAPYSARTRVHEYGGGALLAAGGTVYFSNLPDNRLYRVRPGADPEPLTPELGDVRYADMFVDAARDRLLCVVEDHRGDSVVNDIRTVALGGGQPRPLISGNDFYSTPRPSPDGTQLLWLTWNDPNMPWDGTELWLADIDGGGGIAGPRLIAGGAAESIFQPSWSGDGAIYFCSDRTGWWNLYRWRAGDVEALAPMQAECGRPQWVFRMPTYAHCDSASIAMIVVRNAVSHLVRLDLESGRLSDVATPFTALANIDAVGREVVAFAAAPRIASGVVRISIDDGSHATLRRASSASIDEGMLSAPEAITFPGHGGAIAHAFLYPPHNEDHTAPAGTLPPLLVGAHGGPTGSRGTGLDAQVQYWTSRGFAYLDVNYGGSTGYGRAYRERLNGQWGVVDVGDCVAGARHLADTGRVDPLRLLVHGGSAGGYVVLCALAFHDAFAAGTSYYGVADIELLDAETHKFEARYDESLIGPYPERRDLYRERSPIHFIDRVRAALLLLQGADDPVVPRDQADLMFEAVRAAGVPCALITFAGEQHGFRDSENIRRALEAELSFYSQVLGFDVADDVEPVRIDNLEVSVSG